ncbi:hypothetical protein PRZ48_004001 [Zasmidium cellare]|uniref:Palmitoyl-protein thioesterase 1 n=1 Tax=Zasmidium cellare TaxID=395010 RepID=A0ABR0EXZ0_ZASCE|nr:hypothetical protein PRZ48_004001 [Zasmidium cellare]
MRLLALPAATLALLTLTSALPSPQSSKPLPLLIWHGLGDRYDAEGLHSVGELAKKIHPGTYVHYIRLNDDGDEDRKSTFFGNVTAQIEQVCSDLHNDKELRSAAGGKHGELLVDAIGFSQGGQFLRGLLQTCDGLSIRNLITFGSQHNGIAAIKACGTWDLLCKGALALMKSNAWTQYVQSNVVPAQYYRTLNESTGLASEEFLESSGFLADINNEREGKNETYKERLINNLRGKFIMFVFEDDTTVIPLESGWFQEVVYNKTQDGEEERIVVPLRDRPIYQEDWLGLKVLDQRGSLVFRRHPGDHMQLDEGVLEETFGEFLGPVGKQEVEVVLKEDGEEELQKCGDIETLSTGP